MNQSEKKHQSYVLPIAIMFALFFMIAFVTGYQNPLGVVIEKLSNGNPLFSQLGTLANFIAYAFMGYPAGILLQNKGFRVTALTAVSVGFTGVLITYLSGFIGDPTTAVTIYLIGAFVSGFSMCLLNTVVNPMLNTLGGGGNEGNKLLQIGGAFNSAAAVAVYILMGALIGDAAKAKVADATPALFIAGAIFIVAFIVILFSKIEEPNDVGKKAAVKKAAVKDPHSAFSFTHFKLGILAIFLYMSVEVGTPTYILQYLTADPSGATPGMGMEAGIVGQIVAIYWLLMLVGRTIGGSIGGKVSSRAMIATVSTATLALILFGMMAPTSWTINMPGIDWGNVSVVWTEVPVGILGFILVGLCTSVMWGGIFNMAVEGLGKYTSIASGAFMTMVFGCAVMVALQGWIADIAGSYMTSYFVVLGSAAYILFYALIGSKNVNTDIKTTEEAEEVLDAI